MQRPGSTWPTSIGNIEANHATPAGHSFHHEVAYSLADGIFGYIDANRGDYQNGWDIDQFPNSVDELTLALYEIIKDGGFITGGFNFDAKLCRQSIDRTDLFPGHVGGMDTLTRAPLAAAELVESETLFRPLSEHCAGWSMDVGERILTGAESLDTLEAGVMSGELSTRNRGPAVKSSSRTGSTGSSGRPGPDH